MTEEMNADVARVQVGGGGTVVADGRGPPVGVAVERVR